MGLCASKDAVPSSNEEPKVLKQMSDRPAPINIEADETLNIGEMPFSPSHMPFSPTYKNVPIPRDVSVANSKSDEVKQLAFDSPEAIRSAVPTIDATVTPVETSNISVPPMMQGFIEKQGHIVKNWKNRYFVLVDGVLRYFELPDSSPPYGSNLRGELLHLEAYAITEDEADIPADMWRNCDKDACHILLTPSVTFKTAESTLSEEDCPMLLLQFDSSQRMTTWFAALKTHIVYKRSLKPQ